MSGRNKWRELVRPIYEDPVRRARVEELAREYDALIAQHETQGTPGGPVVGEDRPEGAKNRPRDSGHRA